ncbi:AAA family ATPase [Arcicella rigui]|uniref:DUF3696 domain-containing protein n=1 Tax=Arcicella rigui TaxID=797020 RepID=A0ABU5QBW8_9BACT|nr:DUF3696 domain-containing protein [Arcicella rigui]MEA5140346.1 DUF3696 domain-containing protein [Arcicella rigui]
MVNKITFTNYKIFNSKQSIELAPMTILIGKNSSGKSALAKLPTLISGSLSGRTDDCFTCENEGVVLGNNYSDLNYEKDTTGEFVFKLELKNRTFLYITVKLEYGGSKLTIYSWNYNDEFKLQYHFKEKLYSINNSIKLYDCRFKGFLLEKIVDFEGEIEIPNLINFSFEFDYVCSYRVEPKDIKEDQPKEKNIRKIGIDGKHAYEILINDAIYSDGQLLNKVSNWYKKVFESWEVNIDRDTLRNKFYFELKRDYPRPFKTSLENVGQGMSQILPLITKSFIEEEKPSLTIIEEPELHLHPSAHGNLAERFAESLIDVNKRYLIETHSENFILRLRRLIAESKYPYFTEQNLKIYYVYYDEDLNESFLREVVVEGNGNVKNWPKGVFSESMDELLAMKNAQK